ncbi:MAG: formate dehydrogenase subunit delta [Actinobacteria bacterium]|nr:formate dehydrogenase subunit delta [Actinomycetota bacterium]
MRADVIRMANQIAAQFRHLPADQAVPAVAGHLRDFWEHRMRVELLALVDAGDPELDPVVRAAAQRLRAPAGS